MKMTRFFAKLVAFSFNLGMAILVCLQTTSDVSAQSGFGRNPNQPFDGSVRVINQVFATEAISKASSNIKIGSVLSGGSKTNGKPANVPSSKPSPRVNLEPVMRQAWQKVRPELVKEAHAYLHERDIGGGFRTSRNTLTLAEQGSLFVGHDARGFTLRYVLKGNNLRTWLRVPGPTSRHLDPGFTVNFDLEATVDVDFRNDIVVVSPAKIKLHVYRPQGLNLTGKAALALDELLSFMRGDELVGKGLAAINKQQFSVGPKVKLELEKLHPMLAKRPADVFVQPGYDQAKREITLTLKRAGTAPIVR